MRLPLIEYPRSCLNSWLGSLWSISQPQVHLELHYGLRQQPHPERLEGENGADPPEERFQYLLEGLPPELYNMIYDWTFSPGPTFQHLDQGYKPATNLQVNHERRELLVKPHYNLTTFKTSDQGTMRGWVRSLDPKHRRYLKNIHLDISRYGTDYIAEKAKLRTPRTRAQKRKAEQESGEKIHLNDRGKVARKANKSDMNQAKKAEARLFFLRGYLRKRKIRLDKKVVKVNVLFEGMEEQAWTSDPIEFYKACREGRAKEREREEAMAQVEEEVERTLEDKQLMDKHS